MHSYAEEIGDSTIRALAARDLIEILATSYGHWSLCRITDAGQAVWKECMMTAPASPALLVEDSGTESVVDLVREVS